MRAESSSLSNWGVGSAGGTMLFLAGRSESRLLPMESRWLDPSTNDNLPPVEFLKDPEFEATRVEDAEAMILSWSAREN